MAKVAIQPAQGKSGVKAAAIDFLVLGAGIFGIYAALLLKARRLNVLLVEREPKPWQKASAVNQARLHLGYHYPRSTATAVLANGHRRRFYEEHKAFVNDTFTQYYAIDRLNSLTDASQFERFCTYIDIPARRAIRNDIFVGDRLEALYETPEYSFDPFLLRRHYTQRLVDEQVACRFGTTVVEAHEGKGEWEVTLRDEAGALTQVTTKAVVNATYANLNAMNRMFGIAELEVVHEISEMVLFKSAPLAAAGLTVMDGPFASVMPYGKTGLHSLSSVLYTHHALSTQRDPVFGCQTYRADCTPAAVKVCTTCPVRPLSNAVKMRAQMNLYVRPELEFFEHGSLFTVKTKLKSSAIDDSRPTEIGLLKSSPLFFSVFSGKVNSIYELEALLDHV